ncbi:MAG: dUTP diphosphatase [Congregibacter sp.]|nr:dUTP diphosphatase [Congregibacter sp.]
MQEALTTMLRMQDRMNTRVHPQWKAQRFAWHRAIWVECAELVDHHGYKWWKHQQPDLEQVQLEVVDIWQLGMSAYFREDSSAEQLAIEIMALWPKATPTSGVLEAAEAVAAVAAGERRFCVASFAALLSAASLDFTGLYRQYLGKNVLNFFRQDHGYQDGSYRKLWAGREDNEHLMELLADIDTGADDAEAQLYTALAARYSTSV